MPAVGVPAQGINFITPRQSSKFRHTISHKLFIVNSKIKLTLNKIYGIENHKENKSVNSIPQVCWGNENPIRSGMVWESLCSPIDL